MWARELWSAHNLGRTVGTWLFHWQLSYLEVLYGQVAGALPIRTPRTYVHHVPTGRTPRNVFDRVLFSLWVVNCFRPQGLTSKSRIRHLLLTVDAFFCSYLEFINTWLTHSCVLIHFQPVWTKWGQYSTELFTDVAVDVIQKHDPSQPLFLYLPYQAVHSANYIQPLQAPPEEIEKFKDIQDENRRVFAAMVSSMDEGVGKVRWEV